MAASSSASRRRHGRSRPWTIKFGNRTVLLDRPIFADHTAGHLSIFLLEGDDYARVSGPDIEGSQDLHVYLCRRRGGEIPEGYVVHHRDHNKLNNQLRNLKVLTRAEHARLHQLEAQKFGYRKPVDLRGFYDRTGPNSPRTRKVRPELKQTLERTLVPPNRDSANALLRRTEERARLADVAAVLNAHLAHLGHSTSAGGTSLPAPREQWLNPETRRLGIQPIRTELLDDETAVILALVAAQMDRDQASRVLGISRGQLERYLSRPAVSHACQRWLRERILPGAPRRMTAGAGLKNALGGIAERLGVPPGSLRLPLPRSTVPHEPVAPGSVQLYLF